MGKSSVSQVITGFYRVILATLFGIVAWMLVQYKAAMEDNFRDIRNDNHELRAAVMDLTTRITRLEEQRKNWEDTPRFPPSDRFKRGGAGGQ